MILTTEQIRSLINSVKEAKRNTIDCDGCFEQLAEFSEMELVGAEIPTALARAQRHLDQCPCCNDEYNAMLEGLRSLDLH